MTLGKDNTRMYSWCFLDTSLALINRGVPSDIVSDWFNAGSGGMRLLGESGTRDGFAKETDFFFKLC